MHICSIVEQLLRNCWVFRAFWNQHFFICRYSQDFESNSLIRAISCRYRRCCCCPRRNSCLACQNQQQKNKQTKKKPQPRPKLTNPPNWQCWQRGQINFHSECDMVSHALVTAAEIMHLLLNVQTWHSSETADHSLMFCVRHVTFCYQKILEIPYYSQSLALTSSWQSCKHLVVNQYFFPPDIKPL